MKHSRKILAALLALALLLSACPHLLGQTVRVPVGGDPLAVSKAQPEGAEILLPRGDEVRTARARSTPRPARRSAESENGTVRKRDGSENGTGPIIRSPFGRGFGFGGVRKRDGSRL